MKTLKIFLFLISLIGLISCKKDKEEEVAQMDVQQYIQQLKTNEYKAYVLPAFTPQDIEALLQFRNDTQIITDFPNSTYSSYYQRECTLGIYVLWTIESIRSETAKNKMMMGFPSQNPILCLRNVEEMSLVFDNNAQTIAAKAYFDWWEANKNKDFNQAKVIDPLENTDYRWH